MTYCIDSGSNPRSPKAATGIRICEERDIPQGQVSTRSVRAAGPCLNVDALEVGVVLVVQVHDAERLVNGRLCVEGQVRVHLRRHLSAPAALYDTVWLWSTRADAPCGCQANFLIFKLCASGCKFAQAASMFNESSQQVWLSETAHPSRHDFEKLQPNIDAQGICDISVWPAHNPHSAQLLEALQAVSKGNNNCDSMHTGSASKTCAKLCYLETTHLWGLVGVLLACATASLRKCSY